MATKVDDWRLLNLADGSLGSRNPFKWFLNLLKVRRRLRELDAVAAAVSRCEVILREDAPPAPKGRGEATRTGFAYRMEGSRPKRLNARGRGYPSFSGRFDFVSGDSRTESPAGEVAPVAPTHTGKEAGPPRDLLLGLVQGEKALERYLVAAGNDPARAFANAKGDVAYLDRLRSSDLLKFKPRAAFGKALLPIAIVIITAFSANVVGVRLQSQSMENNRRFEANLDNLREGKRMAGNLYASAVDFHLRTASQEANNPVGQRAIDTLEDFRRQWTQVRNMIFGKSNADINSALKDAEEEINKGEACFRKEMENSKPPNPLCADQFSYEPFLRLQDTISLALSKYIEPPK